IFKLLNETQGIDQQISRATRVIVEDHRRYLKDQYEAELIDITDQDTSFSLANLREQLDKLKAFKNTFHNELTEEVNLTLNNAYLMPAQLRDLAQLFLESQQKDFKIAGFFRNKKRTEEEKVRLLNLFLTELQKTIKSIIQWRLRDKLSELLRAHNINEEDLFKAIQDLEITYNEDNLLKLVNPGATVNGNYVLNYTNDVSSNIKTL